MNIVPIKGNMHILLWLLSSSRQMWLMILWKLDIVCFSLFKISSIARKHLAVEDTFSFSLLFIPILPIFFCFLPKKIQLHSFYKILQFPDFFVLQFWGGLRKSRGTEVNKQLPAALLLNTKAPSQCSWLRLKAGLKNLRREVKCFKRRRILLDKKEPTFSKFNLTGFSPLLDTNSTTLSSSLDLECSWFSTAEE